MPKKRRPSPSGLEILREETGELALFINGRHVRGNSQTVLALLARLFDNLGTVIPYEDPADLWLPRARMRDTAVP